MVMNMIPETEDSFQKLKSGIQYLWSKCAYLDARTAMIQLTETARIDSIAPRNAARILNGRRHTRDEDEL